MAKRARPYLAALLGGALLIPTGSLVPPASARPLTPFLAAIQIEQLAQRAFGVLLPGPSLRLARSSPRAAAAAAIPAVRTVVVRQGQALWDIARAQGTSVEAIVAANRLRSAELVQPGQRLVIPTASAGPATPPTAAAVRKPTASGTAIAATARYHVVASGDTLWSVARRSGMSVNALAQANAIRETALIRPGQRLALAGTTATASAPRRSASTPSRTITVTSGQTLSAIAQAYGVSTRTLVQANNLRSAHAIRAGQRLTIPGASAAGSAPSQARGTLPPARVQTPPRLQPRVSAFGRGFFSWPARGVITSRFGFRWRRHHNGIDIAAPRGTPIYAARSGVVTRTGWYYGYGLVVMVDHGGGVTSIYGHASALLVRTGQRVAAGQLIARVGCTGSCTGNHVHFEVRVNGRPVNPLRYL